MRGCGEVCVVVVGGMHGCMGGMCGCWGACMVAGGWGACVVAGGVPGCRGACIVARGHAWLWGVCACLGHAWFESG